MIHTGPDHRINCSGDAITIKLAIAAFSLRTPSIFISSAVNVIVEYIREDFTFKMKINSKIECRKMLIKARLLNYEVMLVLE